MSKQISGSIDWPWPTMFYDNRHNELVALANNTKYDFKEGAEFKIVFVSIGNSNGWKDSWVGAMGETGDIAITYGGVTPIDSDAGLVLHRPNNCSYNYPIFSVAPIGHGIIYGDMIEENEFEYLNKTCEGRPFPIAYTYNVDTDIVNVLFSNDNTISFALNGSGYYRHNWASAHFSNAGLHLYRYSFRTEEELCQKIQE